MSNDGRQNVYENSPVTYTSLDAQGIRKEFSRRLRAARTSLGYTQEQMAYALGINFARYNKYEIGRSEAPYDVLCRIAQVADVDLNYLIVGQVGRRGRRREAPDDQLAELLQAIPAPAILYDKDRRLIGYNNHWRDVFFPDHPKGLLRRGTPQEVLIRAWTHTLGLGPSEIQAYVKTRLNSRLYAKAAVEMQVGPRRLHIAETAETNKRLVLITDLTDPNRIVV